MYLKHLSKLRQVYIYWTEGSQIDSKFMSQVEENNRNSGVYIKFLNNKKEWKFKTLRKTSKEHISFSTSKFWKSFTLKLL